MVLATEAVSVQFGGVQALRDVTITVRRGEVYGLIGPNGAGKTTLFDVLSGVRPPRSGRVLLNGQDVTDRSATWRARHGVRRTFQRQQVFGGLSAEDNVVTALEWPGLYHEIFNEPEQEDVLRALDRWLAATLPATHAVLAPA